MNNLNIDKHVHLTYGSIISISHESDNDSFITSDGFVKRNIILRNYVTFKIHRIE